ncbi:MAG: CHASE2 domain-containing protein [Gaiellaceae bacterium]
MRSTRRGRFRLALFLITGLGAAAIALTAYFTGILRSQELATVDVRFSIRGTQPQPKDVVVVRIDDNTFNDFKNLHLAYAQWPFSRFYHAKVINTLRKDGAKVIAYDIQFTEQSAQPGADNALITAVRRAGNVVLATIEVNSKGQSDVFGGPPTQRYARAEVGDASYNVNSGGTIRKMLYSPQGLTSFPVAAAEKFLDTKITPATMGGNSAWIDYVGPPGTIRGAADSSHPQNEISFSQVYLGKVPASVFRGKIVVVGPASPTLGDVHATSTTGSSVMSGAEVEANAIETALQGFPLHSYPRSANILLIILLALIPSFIALNLPPLRALLLTIGLAAGFAAAVQFAFNHGRIVTFVYPLLALAISAIGSLAVNYLLTAFDRERTRNAFARFVPEGVVTQVLAQAGDGLRLGGRRVVCTLLFSDIRGFTTLSESREAEEVIDILNHYLTEMTDAVLDNGGTLVSYAGDGILACFGAPIEQADHADRALAAAREMIEKRLPAVNTWLRERDQAVELKIGIGLNSGATMVGNVGSERRLEYTTIGDTVNTASRLEGMTKGTPYSIFVADSTRELLNEQPEDLAFVDELAVRGRAATVKVWAVPDPPPPEEKPVEAGPELAPT